MVPREAIAQAKACVFDFDGTLVDSNPIKWAAFESCFSDFPDQKEEILRYCRGNSHTNRWDKFRYVFESILKREYTPQIEADLVRRFERATTAQIAQAPAYPGAERLLLHCRREGKRTYLLSSTPAGVLQEILRRRGWLGFFDGIGGAPVDKAQWLKQLMGESALDGAEVLFFGDTPEDARSAEEAGCRFVAVDGSTDFTAWIS